MFDSIKKRDGRIIEFNSSKITLAIARAGKATRSLRKGGRKNKNGPLKEDNKNGNDG